MLKKPRIAIIGGGIFGVSIARELADFATVTIFERNNDIFEEASRINQNRHHYGYHYHQSDETALQCKLAKKDFESVWGASILNDFPSYWAIAKKAYQVTPEKFRDFCKKHKLPYEEEWPAPNLLNRDEIAACFKTHEPVYDSSSLKNIAKQELSKRGVIVKTNHIVKDGKITDRYKVLSIQHNSQVYSEKFDLAINATYININVFCEWFNFPQREIDFRLKELLFIRIPDISPVGITIADKFVSILPVNHDGVYTLGDVVHSFHEKRFSSGGMPWTKEELAQIPSHRLDLLEGNFHFIPILEKAEFLESKWTVLPVKSWLSNDDDRTTEIIDHGYGCWSVLGGKIITSVTTAKKIAKAIRKSY